jgi:hypothetical protein
MDVVDAVLSGTSMPPDEAAMARLGRRLAALFFSWRACCDPAELIGELIRRAGLSEASALGRTALEAGARLLQWGGYPYHCALHHAEVATSAMVLAALGDAVLAPEDLGLLLCASLAHDLEFDPALAASGRFVAEARAAAALEAIAAACRVAPAERQALRLLILATEPLARAGLRAWLRQGVPHPDARLRGLGARPGLLALAAVLSDADLLPSSGLTTGWQVRQQDRLALEWARAVTPADRRHFFHTILGPDYLSPGGARFLPNLRRIRAVALADLRSEREDLP